MKKVKTEGVAEIKLSYTPALSLIKQPKISSSKDAYDILTQKWDLDTIDFVEEFKVLLLSRGNNVIGLVSVSKGGVTGTVADPRVIIVAALKANACQFIIAHNHPSGNLTPSQADLDLTAKIKEGANLLDLKLLDHLIISRAAYYSFGDEGLL